MTAARKNAKGKKPLTTRNLLARLTTEISRMHEGQKSMHMDMMEMEMRRRQENKKILDTAMFEIRDMRRELKEDISALGNKFDAVATDVQTLKEDVKTLRGDVKVVTMNQTTFFHNHEALERRVAILEAV